MSKMSKEISSKLICVTGKPGNGKTYFINYLKQKGYKVFIMDEWVHLFYKIGNKGYELIKKEFGDEYVTSTEVDRKKLAELVINDEKSKKKLDDHLFQQMHELIHNLTMLNEQIFVELGIYAIRPLFFKDLFKFVIAINSNRILLKNPKINKFYENIKFSTKPVGNSKKLENIGVVYVDFIVENFGDLKNFKNNIKNLLEKLNNKI